MSARLKLLDPAAAPNFHGMVGSHPSMRRLADEIGRAAPLDVPILIQGPTGVGKELVAQALHALSGRTGQMVSVNVATLPEQLAESELFGSVRGAYTGADADRKGLIETAEAGTLYLDEATDLSPVLQAKLLRALETGVIRRVGATGDRRVCFRLVLSAQKSPNELLAEGVWRLDFYYRVAGVVLIVPPLSERTSDIGLLLDDWLARIGREPLGPGSADLLAGHPWPGNVRELKRALERAVFAAGDRPVTAQGVLDAARALSPLDRVPLRRVTPGTLRDVEREHIERVLRETDWNTRAAALLLGVSVGQLYRRYEWLGITPPRRRISTGRK